MRTHFHLKTALCIILNFICVVGVLILLRISTYDVLQEESNLLSSQQSGIIYPSREDLNVLEKHNAVLKFGPLFHYIHTPKLCNYFGSMDKNILILVKSAVKNFDLRKAVRSTWGSVKYPNIILAFLLAYNNTEMQEEVDLEYMKYGDIVQQHFQDAYHNNTYKSIMSYHYAEKHCSDADLVLFIDDDFYLDMDRFIGYVKSLNLKRNSDLYEGFLLRGKVDRNIKSKWYVPYKDYPFFRWPLYLAGGAYVATMPVIRKFNRVFPLLRHSDIDDAWLGVVAKEARVVPTDNKFFHNAGRFAHLAFLKVCSHDPNDMISKWNNRQNLNTKL